MHLRSASRWPSLVFLLAVGPTLAAATLTVDDNAPAGYSSITAALAAATAGDVIQVAAGTYDQSRETFPLALKDGVAIVGAGRDVTSIVTGPADPAFFNSETPLGPTSRVAGFTITQEPGSDVPLMLFLLGDATMSPRIEGNRFLGNDDESDNGFVLIADGNGGVFDGVITGNELLNLGAADSLGPVLPTAAAEEGFGGGAMVMGRLGGTDVTALASPKVKPAAALPGEDQLRPTISGNTFEGNGFGIVTIGSTPFDCGCETSGVMAPVIDDNTFTANGIDNLLVYAGFGFREFSPTISNNTSTGSIISILSAPYFFESEPPPASGAKTGVQSRAKSTLLDYLRQMKADLDAARLGKHRTHTRAKRTATRVMAAAEPEALYDVTISGNTITDPLFMGMFFFQYMDPAIGLTLNAAITGNAITTSSAAEGGIIFGTFVEDETTQFPGMLRFERNHVSGASTALGILLGNAVDAPLVTQRVKAAAAGPGTAISIVGNRLENGEAGLLFQSDNYTTQAPLVSCNVIINNSVTGVTIGDSLDPTPDFGGGAAASPGLNAIHDNAVNMESEDTEQVKAENNWWGTTNSAAIDASINGDVDFTPFLTAEPVGCIVAGAADLELEKTVTSTGPYVIGSNITYQLTVTNHGPSGATDVVVTDPIPAGTVFVSASPGCTASATTITCTEATLANGASESFAITLLATAPGDVANSASVDSAEDDPVAGNSSDTAPVVTVGAAAAAADIPTASEWGLLLMGTMLAMAGLWFTRRT